MCAIPVIVYMGWVGGVSTHVAQFTHAVFHRNLFQLEYFMLVRYRRADIIKYLLCDTCSSNRHTTLTHKRWRGGNNSYV